MSDQSLLENEQNLSSIQAMLTRERSIYKVTDSIALIAASPVVDFGDYPVDPEARDAIANWIVKVVDLCHYNSETAAIAVSFLDRFAATTDGRSILVDRNEYQLASLAALYTAAKIHEQEALPTNFIAKLSCGASSAADIEIMEVRMLRALNWCVNPPTAMWFVRNFLDLVPVDDLDKSSRKLLINLAQFQVTYSVVNYDFCTEYASDIALAALLNAIEGLFDDKDLAKDFEGLLFEAANRKLNSLDCLRIRLCGATYNGSFTDLLKIQKKQKIASESIIGKIFSRQSYRNSPKSVAI